MHDPAGLRLKQTRLSSLSSVAGANLRDASIEAKTPDYGAQDAPTDTPSAPLPASSAPAFVPASWLNAGNALYIWIAIVVACVGWQPLLLGFYYDDWAWIVGGASQGSPFSLARLTFMHSVVDPVRLGLLPARFLGSSLFGDNPLLWQGALLLVNCLVAMSIVGVGRVLTQCRTREDRAITAAAGSCWLLLPWNVAARFWPTLMPSTMIIAAEGLLCVVVIRGWEKNRSRAITAGVLYLWMCLSYEAFYLQWIPIVLIGVALWMAKRIALRPVLKSAIAMVAAQVVAVLWNVYTREQHYSTVKDLLPNWSQVVSGNLLHLLPAALHSVSELSAAIAFCGVIVAVMWLIAHLAASDRPAAVTSFLLAGVSISGGLLSVVVFSLGGRMVTSIGVETRSMVLFNFWILIAAAILTVFAAQRLPRAGKLIFVFALGGFGLCLAAGQVLRATDWATAWNLQKKLLAEAPISDLKRTEPDARIVILNPQDVNGAPIFAESWDINNAIPWAFPFLRSRRFVIYSPWRGEMKWDGRELRYVGQPPLETTAAVYLWRPTDISFWRPAGPFAIHQDLTVDPPR
jgi:hypothetical protein